MPAAWVSAAAAAYGALSKDDAPQGGSGGQSKNEAARSVTSGGSSSKSYIDPRMEEMLYGSGGVIPNAKDWYSKNSSGLNDKMITGMNNQWNQLGSSAQGFNQMQDVGMGLMGGGVASNPFTGGGGMAASKMRYNPAEMQNGGTSPFKMPEAYPIPAMLPASGNGGGGGGLPEATIAPVQAPPGTGMDPKQKYWWEDSPGDRGGS